jgi:putative membrane protein
MATPIVATAQTAQLLLAQHWHGPGVWWPVFPVLWALVVAAIIVTVVTTGRRRADLSGPRAGESRLAERFASGEIDEQEYRERLAVIRDRHK